MPQLWSTGPCYVFVGPPNASGSNAGAVLLGTGERAPEIDITPEYEPVMNDITGTRIEADEAFEGEHATISLDLNYWNEFTLGALQDPVRTPSILNGGTAARGLEVPGDVGSLMLTEGLNHVLYLQFPYSAKPAMRGMVPGYRFPGATLKGQTHTKLGTTNRKVRLVWHCLRISTSTQNSYGNGGLLLYDFGVSALPTVTFSLTGGTPGPRILTT